MRAWYNITHFAFLHPFLRRPQILLTFIRHLTLVKSNLIKQKTIRLLFRIKFKLFHTFSAFRKLERVFTLNVHFLL